MDEKKELKILYKIIKDSMLESKDKMQIHEDSQFLHGLYNGYYTAYSAVLYLMIKSFPFLKEEKHD